MRAGARLLLLVVSTVTCVPMYPKIKPSGVPVYEDLGYHGYPGFVGHHLSGIKVYKDIYGNGYKGLLMTGLGKNAWGANLYKNLGSGMYLTNKKLIKAGMKYSGFGSKLFGDYIKYGVLTNRQGPYGGKVFGAIYGGKGGPFGIGGAGKGLLRGTIVVPKVMHMGPKYMMSYK